MSRVILAMSGGVDSSVATWLLRRSGHDVTGVFMRHGQATGATGYSSASAGDCPDFCAGAAGAKMGLSPSKSAGTKQTCCSAADAVDARRIAERLQIPFYVLNFEDQFERIIDHFVNQYAAGRTPNPCILCNTWLKFGKLFDYADSIGADYVATGHYARLVWRVGNASSGATGLGATGLGATGVSPVPSGKQHGQDARGTPALLRGVDPGKDQAYALFGIDRGVLPRVMFPLGERRKEEIRRIAAELGFAVADKRDSQEICFVPDQDHARLVRLKRPGLRTAGEVVTTDGKVVGRHDGFERFTVGQRKGLGIAMGEPYYVVRIEPLARRVVLGRREELARCELTAGEANWLIDPPDEPFHATVKIRYRSRAVDATVTPLARNRFHVAFDEPRHGVAPGQAAVCYAGDRVLGGGWIE